MMLEWWSDTDCTLYTDQATADMFGKEHVIIILNHNFEIDFLCGWTICERFGVLGVSSRANDDNGKESSFHYQHEVLLIIPFMENIQLPDEKGSPASFSRVLKFWPSMSC